MSTSIMLDLSHQLGLICCHEAHQRQVTPGIKLIRFTQQTCRPNTSICPKQGNQKIWLLLSQLLCIGPQLNYPILVAQVQDTFLLTSQCDNTNNQLQQNLTDTVLSQDTEGSPNLIPLLIYFHLEKGKRLAEAVGSKMIWSSILLNWLLPA